MSDVTREEFDALGHIDVTLRDFAQRFDRVDERFDNIDRKLDVIIERLG